MVMRSLLYTVHTHIVAHTHMNTYTHKELQENYHKEKRSIVELGREVSALLTNLSIAESSLEKVTTI